jgi:hypothetical protein
MGTGLTEKAADALTKLERHQSAGRRRPTARRTTNQRRRRAEEQPETAAVRKDFSPLVLS